MPVKFCTDLSKSLSSSSSSTDMKIFDIKKNSKIQGNYTAMLLYYTELQIPNIQNGYYLHSHNTYSVYHSVLPNVFRPLATLGQHTSPSELVQNNHQSISALGKGLEAKDAQSRTKVQRKRNAPLLPSPSEEKTRSINTGTGTMSTVQTFHFKHKVRETSISMQTIPQCQSKENTFYTA